MNRSVKTVRLGLTWLLFSFYSVAILLETLNGVTLYREAAIANSAFIALKLLVGLLSVVFLLFTSRFFSALFFAVSALFVVSASFELVSSREYGLRSLPIFFKIFQSLFSVYFFTYILRLGRGWFRRLRLATLFNYMVLVLNPALSLGGLGFANYESGRGESFGGTGFLYAGNEVGAALLLATMAMLLMWGTSLLRVMSIFFCSLAAGVLVLSKASIGGVSIAAAIFSILYSPLGGVCALVFASLCFFLFIDSVRSYFELAINRWTYLIDNFGIEKFLLGGQKRVDYIALYMEEVEQDSLVLVFGKGWTGIPENNLFDLTEAFGLSGILVFGIWSYVLCRPLKLVTRAYRTRIDSSVVRTVAAMGICVLIISVLAGHVIQSSLVCPFLACICLPILGTRCEGGPDS